MDIEKFLKESLGRGMTLEEYGKLLSASVSQNITPMVNFVDDPDSPRAKKMQEYIESHDLLPKNYEQTSKEEIVKKGKLLCKKKTKLSKKKYIIMLLAHHGSREALDALKTYNKNPDDELSTWAEMAIDECIIFLDQKEIKKEKK